MTALIKFFHLFWLKSFEYQDVIGYSSFQQLHIVLEVGQDKNSHLSLPVFWVLRRYQKKKLTGLVREPKNLVLSLQCTILIAYYYIIVVLQMQLNHFDEKERMKRLRDSICAKPT